MEKKPCSFCGSKLVKSDPAAWGDTPPIYGLVLVGGRSQRMGTDKGWLDYHGKPQWQLVLELFTNMGLPAQISCREEQSNRFPVGTPLLFDTFLNLGPMGGLLSAFRSNPNVAWLTLACDLPLLTANSIELLLQHRNPQAIATTLHNGDDTPLPEPLIGIWEPKSYPLLLQSLANGTSCLRKFLIKNGAHLLAPTRPEEIQNINSPAEKAALGWA